MKFLEILERAWMVAAIAALALGVFNLISYQRFDRLVYFPIVCAGFCVLIYMNIRGQRRFREKMLQDEAQRKAGMPKGE
ncbi:MAG: hypothetical protein JST76_08670 [Bacteroidetes bacterium]|nr:hypothetical protein [Bacteroidota bacterium]